MDGGRLTVELTDDGDGVVVADGVRVVDPPPVVEDLNDIPDPVVLGEMITLTATGVSSDIGIDRVEFYLDANRNGILNLSPLGGDVPVGTDTSDLGGWTTTVDTTGYAMDEHLFFAVAVDEQGVYSDPATTTCYIAGPPMYMDNDDPFDPETGSGYSETGSGWQTATATPRYGSSFRKHSPGTDQETATWTFDDLQPDTRYHVYITWKAYDTRATNAPFTVSHSDGQQTTILVNQKKAPNFIRDQGVWWHGLGAYETGSGGTLAVTLSADANGIVVADAVRLVEYPTVTLAPQVVDDGDPEYSEVGQGWERGTPSTAYEGDLRKHNEGLGDKLAHWRFEALEVGADYQVFATWHPYKTRATNAPFSIYDGGSAERTVLVNQRLAPNDIVYDDQAWESLGVYTVESGSLVVELSNNANGKVVADAVYVVKVPSVTSPPETIDDGDAAYREVGTGWEESAYKNHTKKISAATTGVTPRRRPSGRLRESHPAPATTC